MAVSTDNARIIDEVDVQYMPIATTATVVIGDLLTFGTSNTVERMTAVADSTILAGVAGSNYTLATVDASTGHFVKVYKRGVFAFNIASSAVAYQDETCRWGSAGSTVVVASSNPVGRLWATKADGALVVYLRIDDYVAV